MSFVLFIGDRTLGGIYPKELAREAPLSLPVDANGPGYLGDKI